MGTRVYLQGVRLSYPHLFQARAVQAGDDPKFGAAFLVPKNHPAVHDLWQAQEQEKANQWGANVPPSVKATVYDGDTDPKYNVTPANHGHYIVNASSPESMPPVKVDQNNQEVIDPATFYAGCYVDVDIGVFPYDKGVSKGIACGLNGVRFCQDGERLDGRPSVEEMFGAPTGAPPPIAGGLQPATPGMAPAGTAAPQPASPQAAPAAAAYGAPPAQPAVAPQPAGVPPTGDPAFLS